MSQKKRAVLVILLIALTIVLVTGGYTFAKYYKSIPTGGGSGKIAQWSFKVPNTSEKIYLTDFNLKDGKIAPGSNGEFAIEVDATGSDVSVDYYIKISNEINIPENMKFHAVIKDGDKVLKEVEEKKSLNELAINGLNGTINFDDKNKKRTIIVYWNWPYETEGGDNLDTQIGSIKQNSIEDSLLCSFDIEIVGNQSLL